MTHEPTPTFEVIAAAANNPNGWVYKVDGDFGPDAYVPPEAILGAWKVDHAGKISGRFIWNPNCPKAPIGTNGAHSVTFFPGG